MDPEITVETSDMISAAPAPTGELSFIELVMNASFLVQVVMFLLLCVSVASWSIIFFKHRQLKHARKATEDFEELFWRGGSDMGSIYEQLNKRRDSLVGSEVVFLSGFREFVKLYEKSKGDPAAKEMVMGVTYRSMKVSLSREVEELAAGIAETLNSEFFTKVSIGISSVVDGLKDLARAYKEARISLEVGKVFDTEKNIVSYENLGIGRLIYQLPTTLCEIFLDEVFKRGSLDSLDRETLMTVQSFFENNLNVSETSRKLFVHRNTLVYRLEKIRKLTGLDLREFEHAVTFKVALMVKKYLTSKPTKF